MLNLDDSQPFPVEDETVEYKEIFNEKCKKEIAAFLNGTQIAYLYLGVKDETRCMTHVYSETALHHIEEQLGRWVSSSIYYPSPVGLVRLHFNGGLLCIEVHPGKSKPYFLDERTYIRNGSESIKASPERVTKMIANQNLDSFDTSESIVQELKFDEISDCFKSLNISFKPRALGFYNSKSKFTNAALLTSNQNPFTVKVVVFDGVTVERFKNRREFRGSLAKQINEVLAFLDLNNPLAARITGRAQRIEQRGYPSVAIREAVINAIVHRSYFSRSPVQIEIFDDRLTILSPGPLPGGMKLEAVLDGQTLPRNPQVIKILNKLKYIEGYGTGIRRIISSYEKRKKFLKFVAKEGYVEVNLPNLNYQEQMSVPADINVLSTSEHGMAMMVSDEQGQIIEYLKSHRSITRAITEGLLDIKGTKANKILKQLVDNNVLKKVGGGSATMYVLVQQIVNNK